MSTPTPVPIATPHVYLQIDTTQTGFNSTLNFIGYEKHLIQATWDLGTRNVEDRVGLDGKAEFVFDSSFGVVPRDPYVAIRFSLGTPDGSILKPIWTGYVVRWRYEGATENQETRIIAECAQSYKNLDTPGVEIPITENIEDRELFNALINSAKYIPPGRGAFLLDSSGLDFTLTEYSQLREPASLHQPTGGYRGVKYTSQYRLFGHQLDSLSTLREGLEQLAEAEQAFIFINREGKLTYIPYFDYYKDASENIDLSHVTDMRYSLGDPFYNEIVVEYSPKTKKTGAYISTKVSMSPNEIQTMELSPKTGDGITNIVINTVNNVSSSNNRVVVRLDSFTSNTVKVTVQNTSSEDQDTTIAVSGNYYEALDKASFITEDYESIAERTRKETKRVELGILSTHNEAARTAGRLQLRYGKAINFIDQIIMKMDQIETIAKLSAGSLINISNSKLGLVDEKHIIIGEQGSWSPTDTTVTYYLDYAERSETLFVLDRQTLNTGVLG